MKALTIKQPWADAIVYGTKRTENRVWTTQYRGPIAIHAGLGYDPMGRFTITDRGTLATWPDTRGAIIAVATLTDCHHDTGCCTPWGEPNVYHWQLADVRPLPRSIPCRGAQRLWTPSADALAVMTRSAGGAS